MDIHYIPITDYLLCLSCNTLIHPSYQPVFTFKHITATNFPMSPSWILITMRWDPYNLNMQYLVSSSRTIINNCLCHIAMDDIWGAPKATGALKWKLIFIITPARSQQTCCLILLLHIVAKYQEPRTWKMCFTKKWLLITEVVTLNF